MDETIGILIASWVLSKSSISFSRPPWSFRLGFRPFAGPNSGHGSVRTLELMNPSPHRLTCNRMVSLPLLQYYLGR